MKWLYGFLQGFSKADEVAAYKELSDSRRNRIERFNIGDDRRRSLLGEYFLKKLLEQEFGLENVKIECQDNGRPFVAEHDIFISVSHSKELVCCAASKKPIGIDVELVAPISAKLVDRVCTENEKKFVLGCAMASDTINDPEILERFFEIWTAKEAYFKLLGTGITNFQSVDVLDLDRVVEKIDNYIITIIENR